MTGIGWEMDSGYNYLAGNKDDHCKNFSFIVVGDFESGWYWKLAPAYDLTLCEGGYNGEHATSVNGTGRPTLNDFIASGEKIRIKGDKCRRLIDEVYSNIGDLLRYKL